MAEARRHLGGRAVGDDATGGDEHDPVAEPLDLDHVVRRDEKGGALGGAQLEQAGADAVGDVGVERCRGLVEDEEARLVQRRLDDADEGPLTRD